MKNNNEKKKTNKSSLSKLSPTNKNKNKNDMNFNLTSFKNYDLNNILVSPKNKEDIHLPKKKVIPYTTYHRKTKSCSQNYIQSKNLFNDSYNNLNKSGSKLSYIFKRNDNKKKNEILNYKYGSRNKYELFKRKFNENKKSSNLLSISFSLKDFRNSIINAFANSNINEIKKEKYSNKSNFKNNKSLFIFDNLNNIEETRNTTSITGFNNSNLLYKNQMLIKDKKNVQSTKCLKINKKPRKQLFSSKNNSSKIITYTNNNITYYNNTAKVKEKKKLYQYIYNNNHIKNININPNKSIKKPKNNPKNLVISKRTYKNSISKLQNTRKISFVNAISENLKLHYKNKINRYDVKNEFNYNIKSVKSPKKKDVYIQFKRRKNKSQENKSKLEVEYNNQIGEFQSVEEIHFIFVQINQKKKAFFESQYNKTTFH